MLGSWITIQNYIAKEHDLQAELLDNSMDLVLKQKYASDEQASITKKYNVQEDAIQEQMDEIGDRTNDEYKDMMAEIKELKDAEDAELKAIEEAQTQMETEIQNENAMLETQLQAIQADKEGLEEARKEDIEDSFGYFQ